MKAIERRGYMFLTAEGTFAFDTKVKENRDNNLWPIPLSSRLLAPAKSLYNPLQRIHPQLFEAKALFRVV